MMLQPSKDKFKFLILIIVIINVRIAPVRFLTARARRQGPRNGRGCREKRCCGWRCASRRGRWIRPVARGAAFIERLRTDPYEGLVWFRGTEGWNCSDLATGLPTPGSSGRSGRGRCQLSKRHTRTQPGSAFIRTHVERTSQLA
jgi:hypothetical protein